MARKILLYEGINTWIAKTAANEQIGKGPGIYLSNEQRNCLSVIVSFLKSTKSFSIELSNSSELARTNSCALLKSSTTTNY